ncbi:hypothetical protein [Saccharopolyspora oryzae]|uniref:Uncharacterized protein n=1 Tax=Saccharopolyspora oryzae TaxID=2997343 RepID=A0ABT4VCK4_9PSEU|nr:hypothetical protein [Saccharopolyspora oryzae]MDA3631141.1 hypothetical protein [Saccharopolyspora oryzae]
MRQTSRAMSAAELDDQRVEFLPARTVMSTLPLHGGWDPISIDVGGGGTGGGNGGGQGGGNGGNGGINGDGGDGGDGIGGNGIGGNGIGGNVITGG